jgi:hypothetical protein
MGRRIPAGNGLTVLGYDVDVSIRVPTRSTTKPFFTLGPGGICFTGGVEFPSDRMTEGGSPWGAGDAKDRRTRPEASQERRRPLDVSWFHPEQRDSLSTMRGAS